MRGGIKRGRVVTQHVGEILAREKRFASRDLSGAHAPVWMHHYFCDGSVACEFQKFACIARYKNRRNDVELWRAFVERINQVIGVIADALPTPSGQ